MLTQKNGFRPAMTRRRGRFSGRGVIVAMLALSAALLAGGAAVSRTAFVIATGTTGGTYFPVGEAIATIVSHPPGVYRCEKPGVCGPPGLIASVRTSPGAVANVLAVNAHTVDAALAQSDVIADAVAGRGLFKAKGPQKNVRVLAGLFPEDVHLVARANAHIRAVRDLRGKRVSLGPEDSGTIVTARAVLTAFGVPMRRLKVNNDPADTAADELAQGKLDAMFFVGGAPVPLIRELLAGGGGVLTPIDGAGRARLLKRSRALSATTIPAGLYPKTGKTETVGVHAIFIVNKTVPDAIAYGVLQSLFNPANRTALAGSHRSAQAISIDSATADLPAPLHPGAVRFYREAGKLKPPAKASGKT